MLNFSIVSGDITTLDVNAVVNAANNNLSRGGGLCGAIFEAAGPELIEACKTLRYCETGNAVSTPGFGLRARYIIHAVGPRYFLSPDESPSLLENAYLSSLREAKKLGARSIAFPCLSTGIYGYPIFPAAKIAVRTVQRNAKTQDFDTIIFCCFNDESFQIYKRLLNPIIN